MGKPGDHPAFFVAMEKMIEEAEKVSEEEVCIISFMDLEANNALVALLDQTFAE